MPQNKEAEAFLGRVKALPAGPGVSLDAALQPSIDDETELRRYFASDRGNARLSDPYVGLVDVFDAPPDIRTTRARIVKDDEDLIAKHIIPVPKDARRAEGAPSMVESFDEFKKNWSIFTEGSLSQLFDWSNVVAAGGSVLACLTPLSEQNKVSKRAIRKYYHSVAYPTSDVDLFLYGMNPEQAEAKIIQIYEAVRDSVPWDVTCIRTKHTVSIHSQYPYRSVQIVLRLYHSPAEILAGFDVDAPCVAYDGDRIWANPRSITAMMRQANTVDMSRRSPSYEVRLTKYANRGFEVYVPDLNREKVDPTIYERAINKMEGLARLLVFEKLMDGDARYAFLESRRKLRGRPNPLSRYHRHKRQHKGDLKEENPIGGLEMNDYDVSTLHIPYGPGWDARRINKLVYQTDLGMNSTFNPKNKGRRLHRHPAFFGTMEECLADCCEHCPEPIDDDERELMAKEEDQYIVGRIKFIEENPGRQTMTGSFNPIDVGEWSEQVYVKDTEKFFDAVARNDVEAVKEHIKAEIDLNHRDHVGRTCLHLAVLSNAPQVAIELIEAGARVSARLVDGRSPLHLAARFDHLEVVKKLLERSAANAELVKKDEDPDAMDEDKKPAVERPSSEDDWSSHISDGDDVEMKDADADGDNEDEDDEDEDDEDSDDGSDEDSDKPAKSNAEEPPASNAGDAGVPEDNEDEPDILDINETDWDFGFAPLAYAILYASTDMVDLLLNSGADANKPSSTNHNDAKQLHPLDITILRTSEGGDEEDVGCAMAERLIKGGASSSRADEQMYTIFHDIVASGQHKLAATVLRCDPNAAMVINSPAIRWSDVTFPLVTAIQNVNFGMAALLIAHGVRTSLSEEDITRVVESRPPKERSNLFGYGVKSPIDQAFTPLETAIRANDDIAQMLLTFGVDFNISIKRARSYWNNVSDRRTIKDWVDVAILKITARIEKEEKEEEDKPKKKSDLDAAPEVVHTGWKEHLQNLRKANKGEKKEEEVDDDAVALEKHNKAKQIASLKNTKAYLLDVQRLLEARSAKGWKELHPDIDTNVSLVPEKPPVPFVDSDSSVEKEINSDYVYLTNSYRGSYVPMSLSKLYDELYEACFTGNDDKVKSLCLPSEGESSDETRLLNINVQIGDKNNIYYSSGWTPLFAACAGGHWSTAKLVVAIAAGQYSPEDEDDAKVSFKNINIDDDDSDDSEYDSDGSNDTVGKKKEVQFVDIAAASTVKTEVEPSYMISRSSSQFRVGDEVKSGNLLVEAIYAKDATCFKNIVGLYQSLSKPVDIGDQIDTILNVDSPEILDEYIRRSGYGLDFEVAKKATEHLPQVVNDENRTYLGLNVHGKKRADLARKNDPNAAYDSGSRTVPLVWRAAKAGATKIIEYLSTDKPIASFKHYSTASSGFRAEQLRRTPDLEKVLPLWLGWSINGLGESPFTAAIVGNSLEAIKALFSAKPQFMKTTLHQTIKFSGFNAFMLAVSNLAKPEVLDYLLAKSISPAGHDTARGYNVFHEVCYNKDITRLRYLLEKLPKDVVQELLKRQSKGRLSTPLHIAVSQAVPEMVKLILKFDDTTALYRNIDGQTPLHCGVAQGYDLIITELLATPQRGGLFLEDCIGQTPLELAALRELLHRLKQSHRATIDTLAPDGYIDATDRIAPDHVEEEVPVLRKIVKQMLDEGRPKDPQKFNFEMTAFANMMEKNLEQWKQKLAALPPKPEPKEEVDENPTEHDDVNATWRVIHGSLVAAVEAGETHRGLAKLLDVQQSVKAKLDDVSKKKSTRVDYDSDAEEDPEEVEANQCMFHIPRSTSHI